MALTFYWRFDPDSQATIERLTVVIGKVATAMSALTDSANTLVAEVHAAITEISAFVAQVKDLNDKLNAALAANDPTEANNVAAQLTQATNDLKTAVDNAASSLPALPTV